MSITKFQIGLILLIISVACKRKTDKKEIPVMKDYFSITDDCELQRKVLNSENKVKLYFFDSKGAIPEDSYIKSPSYLLKNRLRKDTLFYNFAKENFDFFTFTQDCDIGITRTQRFKVRNFPTILLVDPFEKVMFKKVGITSSQNLMYEIEKVLNN